MAPRPSNNRGITMLTVDADKARELADFIEKLPHRAVVEATEDQDTLDVEPHDVFDMAHYREDFGCGTAACIAGWGYILWGDHPDADPKYLDPIFPDRAINESSRLNLGLEIDAADELFTPHSGHLPDITPQDAAAALRHLADTGVVNWQREDDD